VAHRREQPDEQSQCHVRHDCDVRRPGLYAARMDGEPSQLLWRPDCILIRARERPERLGVYSVVWIVERGYCLILIPPRICEGQAASSCNLLRIEGGCSDLPAYTEVRVGNHLAVSCVDRVNGLALRDFSALGQLQRLLARAGLN